MTITTKYDAGDRVWVMVYNKPTEYEIRSIGIKYYEDSDLIDTTERLLILYKMKCGATFIEKDDDIFPIKEDLLKSL